MSAECPKEQAHKLSIKVQGEILIYVGDPRGPASTDLARHCCGVDESSRCDKARGKERSETPTSGVIMTSQRESNVDYPIGMLARQRATNLNLQSNWTGMRTKARGHDKRNRLIIVRCHEGWPHSSTREDYLS